MKYISSALCLGASSPPGCGCPPWRRSFCSLPQGLYFIITTQGGNAGEMYSLKTFLHIRARTIINCSILTRSTHTVCFRSMVTYDKWIYKSNPKFPTPEKVGYRKYTIYKINTRTTTSPSRCLIPLVLTPSLEWHLNVQIRVTDCRQTQDTRYRYNK